MEPSDNFFFNFFYIKGTILIAYMSIVFREELYKYIADINATMANMEKYGFGEYDELKNYQSAMIQILKRSARSCNDAELSEYLSCFESPTSYFIRSTHPDDQNSDSGCLAASSSS